ncbi:MAG: NAD(+) synthase [Firmicutes bacterium]|nr:NAD(+) synthase [Bacillota bacterium]
MKDGFLRVAAATPQIQTANCALNANAVAELARQGAAEGAKLIVFPELCLTGYTCGDLFAQQTLQRGSEQALRSLCEQTESFDTVLVVGLPLEYGTRRYNCAAVLLHGRVLGVVPKKNIPNYGEFYEYRHFAPGISGAELTLNGETVPFGCDLLFACSSMPEFVLGVEICEDLWVPEPPSGALCAAGATVIANPSASDEVIGKSDYRRALVTGQSARTVGAYIYCDAGEGESSTDMVFSGDDLIAENGTLLARSKPFTPGIIFADLDLQRLQAERRRMTTFPQSSEMRTVSFALRTETLALRRVIDPHPFVPADTNDLKRRCEEILNMQAAGLRARLRHTHARSAVVGLSGGLDSTLALLVMTRAFDSLGLDRSGILAVTMPCFGTTARTRSNAQLLAEAIGCSFREVPIADAVRVHLRDIGHDETTLDVTYENAQARERTQVLMDLANQSGGLVIGTGDLSELALGWATYNGDHMSMYGVNASVPKTLVRHLVAYAASQDESLSAVLLDILATPVSPELLPPKDGVISQQTENIVGPYELHDFFLYYIVRFGFAPGKVLRLATHAFRGVYDRATILGWMKTFYRRFFAQQFKRSCLPDGPKVGSVTLSPRSDWRMPSDASAALWQDELERL